MLLLNSYLVNYYSTEIFAKKLTTEKVISLYNLTNLDVINFKIPFDEDKKIEIDKIIENIKSGDKEKINSLGGMEFIRNSLERQETIIPEKIEKVFDIFN